MDELKPCERCGTSDWLYSQPQFFRVSEEGSYPIGWAVVCIKCGIKVERFAKEEAETIWNTRPLEDALRAELAAKDAEIAKRKPIPVSERMPEEGLGVMLFDSLPEYWTIGYLYRLSEDRYQWATINRLYLHDDNFARVTHWMPLPEPPEAQP